MKGVSAVFGALNDLLEAQGQAQLAQQKAQLAMREGVMTAQLEAAQMVGKIRKERAKAAEKEQAQQQAAAPEPFELDLSGTPLQEQPINFQSPISGINPAAFTQAAAAAARPGDGIQQQLKGGGAQASVQSMAEGLPMAGDRIRSIQARTGTQYLQEPGGYVAVPQVELEASEQPNQLTAGDILRARIQEAAAQRASMAEAAQLALRREEFRSDREYKDALLELEERKTTSQERRDELWLKLQMKMAQTRLGRLGVSLTPGEEERDKKYGQGYAERQNKGGFVRAESNIRQLEAALDTLRGAAKNKQNLTGPGVGMVPDALRAFTNKQSVKLRRQVEQVLQQSADEVLDSQYASKELTDLLKRSFDPSLEEADNVDLLAPIVASMRQAVEETAAKDDYFNRLGSLWGFEQFQAAQRAEQGGDVDAEGARVEALEQRLATPAGAPSSGQIAEALARKRAARGGALGAR